MAERTWLAGLDGTREGWVVALLTADHSTLELRAISKIGEVLALPEVPAVVGIDMPIGLTQAARRGGRECDRLARRLLPGRTSSVFSPPSRVALQGNSWEEATQLNRESSDDQIGLTSQTYNLFPKLREIDDFMTPERQRRFREVHPEVSFREMAGRPCAHRKKRTSGRQERVARIIDQGLPDPSRWLTLSERRKLKAAADDILDAIAAAWTARRIWAGTAVRLPEKPDVDVRGLAMEIVA